MAQNVFEYRSLKCRLRWAGAEYWVEADVSQNPTHIDKLGAEGWELIGFYPNAKAGGYDVGEHESIAVFKRLKS